MFEALRLKPDADSVTSKQVLAEGLFGVTDSVHEIDYPAIDPQMTAHEQEALRVHLLALHVQYSALTLIFGRNPEQLGRELDFIAQTGVSKDFISYARWRMNQTVETSGD